ncbi:MAG: family 20 glycosylhydrolase [Acidobacteriaceae bacterium]|nr:family 20 glycosylhydrolase [Acidobacteriaceae bacterium]
MLTAALALPLAKASLAQSPSTFTNELLPQPMQLRASARGSFRVAAGWNISSPSIANPTVSAIAKRTVTRLQNETGIWFSDPWQPSAGKAAALTLAVEDTSVTQPYFGMDESYRLDVDASGAHLSSHTLFGLQRGVETFLQLVQHDPAGYYLPSVHIDDAPRFAWRGLMLDAGRHFQPVSVVLRTLDAMASVKLNVLHLHLSENQGFRVESKRFPKLTGEGSNGEFYTQADIHHIVAYATSLGIRVVPEFDLPGHTTSWFVGYPELASLQKSYQTDRTFGVHDEAIDPTRESTYKFLDAFFGEMAELFPDSYVHIGGDESNGKQWQSNPAIQAFMKDHHLADKAALQAYFNRRLQEILQRHGKKMVGWDEIIHPDLPSDVIVQNWHGVSFLAQAARDGHRGFSSKPYYLDHNETAESMYKADPVSPDAHLTDAQAKLIVGGEACMWSEQAVPLTIDSRIWPRTAAVAERLWSPATVVDIDDMYRRLRQEELRLDAMGIENLSGPQRMLRQLLGQRNPVSLQVLANAVQPDDFHDRARLQKNTVDTPMTGFVDSVVFDPPLRHDLQITMQQYLQGNASDSSAAQQRLQALFSSWQQAGDALKAQCAEEPRLNVVASRAAQLADLGRLSLAVLQSHQSRTSLPASQHQQLDALFEKSSARDASMVEFVVLPPLKELLKATP